MAKKDVEYKIARDYLYNKDRAINQFINNMLIKCNQMFIYNNLPDTIPKRTLENYLLRGGYCIFTKHDDKYYVFNGGLSGELNYNYEYTKCIVTNHALKLNKEYTIDDDCILIRNDSQMLGLIPLLSKYGVLCGDCEISLNMLTNVLRTQFFISAGDNKTKENADVFIQKLINGEFTAIGENTFLDGVKVHNVSSTANYIQQFIELNQYLKASAFNEIGLDANFNMKRERMTVNEIEINTSILIPLADNMLEERKLAVEKINKKYGLNISVDLNSVWKMQKETVDKTIENQNTDTITETVDKTIENQDTDTITETRVENE